MSTAFLQDERLVDLLVKQTTEGLAPAEKAELERLMTRHRDADPELIERVAAAVTLAGPIDDEPMPADLRRRVEAEGRRIVAGSVSPVTDIRTRRRAEQPGASPSQWLWLAAAASVVLAVVGWWPRLRDAVSSVPRVLANPACTVQLTRLGPEGLELTVGVTISDVAYGEGNVRSDVNLAILRCLDEAGVELARPLQLSRPT